MNHIFYLLVWVSMLVPMLATAEPVDDPDPEYWLERVRSANKHLDYVGTFIYQSGKHVEASRIIHRIDEQGEYERIEALDGRPREMVRFGDEVHYLMPEQDTFIVDRLIAKRTFPAWVSASAADLAKYYQVQLGDKARVAGVDAQIIELTPRDSLRYRHMLWVDRESGLLVKSLILNEKGDVLERVSFNEVHIGEKADRALLQQASDYDTSNWREVNVCGTKIDEGKLGWRVSRPLPGFRLISSKQRSLSEVHGDVTHLVFSDGLVAISVFIEARPSGAAAVPAEPAMIGATSLYKRVVANYVITVVGEVPAQTVQKLGQAVERVTL